ncbi:MAG TPA: VWA domain-containing protein, partial [Vicinamibacterales bacterium]|nr:VWA domain-containing protein [Vicinamibacterales bacterium]
PHPHALSLAGAALRRFPPAARSGRRRLLLVATVLVAAAILHASAQAPQLRITAPTESTYLAGEVLLRATVEPSSTAVVEVTFFADGTKVCTVTTPPFECKWDAGARIKSHQIRAVATLKNGERPVQTVTTRNLEYVESVDVDVVQVAVVVTDDRGRFVPGLTQSDFQVSEDGVPQKISSFSGERTPLELVTAIDVSSSVTQALPDMKAAAVRFLAGLDATDQATVVGFNDSIFTLARRSTDQTIRERAIGRLKAWGGTALYDAIVHSIDTLARQTGRRAIVLFTDGEDQNSHAPMGTAIAQVEASEAMIYVVGQGRAVHSKDLQKLLQRIATTSGGRAFFSNTPPKLDEAFAEILDDLHHQYLISYPAPDDQRDGKWHSIRIKAAGGKYKVRARQGYRMVRKN